MLKKLKGIFTPKELLEGNYGIEREGLRVDELGKLALTIHPETFGDKIKNPYITTDFSESQIEVITPVFNTAEEVYEFTKALYDIVALEMKDEYIWPQSMPCIIPEDKDIPVAEIGESGKIYRENLMKKYGGKKQLISGIHYNFSFSDDFLERLHKESTLQYKDFKDEIYLKVSRNYLRYRWLIIYLFGSTTTLHESFRNECRCNLDKISKDTYSNSGALSYRNGTCGYKNKVDLFPNYDSINNYTSSIKQFITDGVIENHKELYSQVRLKPKDIKTFFTSLEDEGIQYLEYRSLDINPFEKGGISLEDLEFLQIFNLYLLITEENGYKYWQEDALKNQHIIARNGLEEVFLNKDGELILKEIWAMDILNDIKMMNDELNLGREDVINLMMERVKDPRLTYAHRITEKVKEEGFINAYLSLAKKYKESAYNNRFKLEGYEDLELSTQILIRESIKKGIKVEIIDRQENFISLRKDNKIEYVKEATKTSKDNYASVLIMEDKWVTNKILRENNINVPIGEMFNSLDESKLSIKKFINKPIVVKPKSTNFGKGINIFKDGASAEDIYKAFVIAFEHDKSVLVEEFIHGKEYRFLVIDDKVVGILHRVPANVIGDGFHSIKELVSIKNEDSLRGYKYRTPLEKIQLDSTVQLYLKGQNKDIYTIPDVNEIVYLRENSNISTGGDSIDYTDIIPNKFKEIAVKAAQSVGAKICGVDMMLTDCTNENSIYGIIELNFNPAIHIHCYPFKGEERNIAIEVLKLLEF